MGGAHSHLHVQYYCNTPFKHRGLLQANVARVHYAGMKVFQYPEIT